MKRAVRTLIRLIAAALVLFGGMGIGLEFLRHRMKNAEINIWNGMIGATLVLLGAILYGVSAKLANRWTKDFDE